MEVFPSPKFQYHAVGPFVEVSVNCTVIGLQPDVRLLVKLAMGADPLTVIYPFLVDVLLPHPFDAVREIENTPWTGKIYSGFCKVDEFPSPKPQFHEVGPLVEVSANCTAIGWQPEVRFALKLATGWFWLTII